MYVSLKTLYKGINVIVMLILDLKLLQDRIWMKKDQFNEKKEKSRCIVICISYCNMI